MIEGIKACIRKMWIGNMDPDIANAITALEGKHRRLEVDVFGALAELHEKHRLLEARVMVLERQLSRLGKLSGQP